MGSWTSAYHDFLQPRLNFGLLPSSLEIDSITRNEAISNASRRINPKGPSAKYLDSQETIASQPAASRLRFHHS